MEIAVKERKIELYIAPEVLNRAKEEGRSLVLYPTLKFSCFIAKRFRAEIGNKPEGEILHLKEGDVDVYVVFRAVGSRFCGGERGFEEFDMPITQPERFLPKWIKVNPDLSGEFGYV